MLKRNLTYCLLYFFLLSCFQPLNAQENAFGPSVQVHSIDSEILRESREILIYEGEVRGEEHPQLPVLILLDGGENMLLTLGIIQNLQRADVIPPVHVVGINNYNYDRLVDLTPKKRDGSGDGRALDFHRFIEQEVFPFVNGKIKPSEFKVLIGHSLGGLFSTLSLIEKTEMFEGHLAIGPSYWFDENQIVPKMKSFLGEDKDAVAGKKLYFSLANETDSEAGFDEVEGLFRGFREHVKFERFPEADHVTALTPALFNGLQFVFSEWNVWDELYAQKDLEGIKSSVTRLSKHFDMKVKPRVPELAYHARSLTRESRFDQSIEILEYLERFHPEHIMVLNFLGEAWQKKGDLSKAASIYKRSLKVAEASGSPMVRWINQRLKEVGN